MSGSKKQPTIQDILAQDQATAQTDLNKAEEMQQIEETDKAHHSPAAAGMMASVVNGYRQGAMQSLANGDQSQLQYDQDVYNAYAKYEPQDEIKVGSFTNHMNMDQLKDAQSYLSVIWPHLNHEEAFAYTLEDHIATSQSHLAQMKNYGFTDLVNQENSISGSEANFGNQLVPMMDKEAKLVGNLQEDISDSFDSVDASASTTSYNKGHKDGVTDEHTADTKTDAAHDTGSVADTNYLAGRHDQSDTDAPTSDHSSSSLADKNWRDGESKGKTEQQSADTKTDPNHDTGSVADTNWQAGKGAGEAAQEQADSKSGGKDSAYNQGYKQGVSDQDKAGSKSWTDGADSQQSKDSDPSDPNSEYSKGAEAQKTKDSDPSDPDSVYSSGYNDGETDGKRSQKIIDGNVSDKNSAAYQQFETDEDLRSPKSVASKAAKDQATIDGDRTNSKSIASTNYLAGENDQKGTDGDLSNPDSIASKQKALDTKTDAAHDTGSPVDKAYLAGKHDGSGAGYSEGKTDGASEQKGKDGDRSNPDSIASTNYNSGKSDQKTFDESNDPNSVASKQKAKDSDTSTPDSVASKAKAQQASDDDKQGSKAWDDGEKAGKAEQKAADGASGGSSSAYNQGYQQGVDDQQHVDNDPTNSAGAYNQGMSYQKSMDLNPANSGNAYNIGYNQGVTDQDTSGSKSWTDGATNQKTSDGDRSNPHSIASRNFGAGELVQKGADMDRFDPSSIASTNYASGRSDQKNDDIKTDAAHDTGSVADTNWLAGKQAGEADHGSGSGYNQGLIDGEAKQKGKDQDRSNPESIASTNYEAGKTSQKGEDGDRSNPESIASTNFVAGQKNQKTFDESNDPNSEYSKGKAAQLAKDSSSSDPDSEYSKGEKAQHQVDTKTDAAHDTGSVADTSWLAGKAVGAGAGYNQGKIDGASEQKGKDDDLTNPDSAYSKGKEAGIASQKAYDQAHIPAGGHSDSSGSVSADEVRKIEGHQRKIDNEKARAKESELNGEITHLQQELVVSKKSNGDLSDYLAQKKKEIADFEENGSQAEKNEISHLKTENSELEHEVSADKQTIAHDSQTISKDNDLLKTLHSQLNDLHNKLNQTTQLVDRLSQQNQELERENSEFSHGAGGHSGHSDNATLEHDLAVSNQQLAHEHEVETQQSQHLAQDQEKIDNLNHEVSGQKDEIGTLNSQINELRHQNQEFSGHGKHGHNQSSHSHHDLPRGHGQNPSGGKGGNQGSHSHHNSPKSDDGNSKNIPSDKAHESVHQKDVNFIHDYEEHHHEGHGDWNSAVKKHNQKDDNENSGDASQSTGDNSQQHVIDKNKNDHIQCFVGQDIVETSRGSLRIDQLKSGDKVIDIFGKEQSINWIGKMEVCGLSKRTAPVLFVKTGLEVSPSHGIFKTRASDKFLVRAGDLVDNDMIIQKECEKVVYYHVETSKHSIICVNNIWCETYLNTGELDFFKTVDGVKSILPTEPCFHRKRIYKNIICNKIKGLFHWD